MSKTALKIVPMLARETLYVGVDIGKLRHVAGFVSTTLLARHQRFEQCPSLVFEQSRDGFRALVDRMREYVPLEQVQVLLEVTGHYHKALVQYLQELDISVYVLHVQKRQAGLLKSDKRDALGLANHLHNALEKGVQMADPLQAVRRLVPPTEAATQLYGMIQHRNELVTERTQRKNKLTSICDEVFPEFTQVCKDPNTASALALRKQFPTPAALGSVSLSALLAARPGNHPSQQKLILLRELAVTSIGTKAPARLRGLAFEQEQLIAELQLLNQHLDALDTEIAKIVEQAREGQILVSIPGIGQIQAAIIIAMLGNIANFERPAQLKSYCGWAPTITQSGKTLDRAKLSPRGVRLMKRTMYLVVWQAIRHPDNEFARIYERLVPRKCVYDERRKKYVGTGKVIGRIAGQIIGVMFKLLKQDQELLLTHANPPEPGRYDPRIHQQHRAGQYQPSTPMKQGKIIELPPH
ncbi:MAG: IS110 family transposase [Ktedonobacteraceae bacterium]|nr:IS110 family transposase [Ktedonobacteraceae bacterium]